ncbi:MAG: YafY family transcriptional regulator [Bacteroidetes bacterium]|nr:YafY family transcriptional regulator [Bacteroidota bacterium]
MNRIDRVSNILIQLQSKRVVKAQDIASRFEISLRTVYRDIRTLEEAGIPLIGEAGVGYSIMEGYKLPPVMFTLEEATAFLTAEKLVEKLTDASTKEGYRSAMYKVRSVLRSSEKDYLENIEEHIHVMDNPYLPQGKEHNHFQTILKNISNKKVIAINYFANHDQKQTRRNIEPIGMYYQSGHWYLIAFCQLRNDYRNFRIDRISGTKPTEFKFSKEHPSLKTYLKQITKEKELHTVIMTMNKDVVRHLGDQKYYNGYVSEKELKDQVEMTFLTCSLEGFARWYMMFGDTAEIISPDSLKQTIKQLATTISKKIN